MRDSRTDSGSSCGTLRATIPSERFEALDRPGTLVHSAIDDAAAAAVGVVDVEDLEALSETDASLASELAATGWGGQREAHPERRVRRRCSWASGRRPGSRGTVAALGARGGRRGPRSALRRRHETALRAPWRACRRRRAALTA